MSLVRLPLSVRFYLYPAPPTRHTCAATDCRPGFNRAQNSRSNTFEAIVELKQKSVKYVDAIELGNEPDRNPATPTSGERQWKLLTSGRPAN